MKLLEGITKEHLLQAIGEINETGIRQGRHSSTYDLIYKGKAYPPKLVISIAARFADGNELDPEQFEGGEGTPAFKLLQGFGFVIKEKSKVETDPWLEIIRKYKNLIQTRGNSEELYKWELIKENSPKMDFLKGDIEKSIKAVKFQNLVYHNGIAALYHLAKDFPEELRSCFRELFDEGVNVEVRITNFTQETLKLYRRKEEKLGHHQDERSVATYLTFKYPEKYTLYKDSFYRELCKKLGVYPEKPGKKYIHYLRLVREFIKNYISKDPELILMKTNFLTPDCFEDKNNMIFAQDILYQVLDGAETDNEQNEAFFVGSKIKTELLTPNNSY